MKNYFPSIIFVSLITLIPVREIFPAVKADSLEAEILYQKAEDFWRDAHYDSSNFYYKKASLLFRDNKNWESYIDCQNNIGVNCRYLGMFTEAILHFNSGINAINNLEKNQDSLRAKLYNNIGFVYLEKGYYDKAYKYYFDMLQINKRTLGDNNISTGKGYQNIGMIYYSTGDYEMALKYLGKALSIFNSNLDEHNLLLANCYNNLSKVYLQKNEYSRSIEYEEKAVEIWKDKLGESHPYIAMSYINLAETYSLSGDYQNALEYNYKAMQIRRDSEGEKSKGVAESYADIGNIFTKMGNFKNGEYFFNKSIAVYRKIAPADPELADAYILSGNLYKKTSRFKTAEAYYDSALHIAWPDYRMSDTNKIVPDNIPDEEQSVKALFGKGNVYLAEAEKSSDRSGLKKVLNLFILASDIIENLKTFYGNEESEFLTKIGFYDVNKNGILTAVKLYQQTNNSDYIETAFQLAEKNKAGVMNESVDESDITKFDGVPDSLIIKEKELQADISLYKTRLMKARQSNDQSAFASSTNMLSVSKDKFDELIKYFEQNFPSYYRLKFPGAITSTNEIRKLLPPDAVLLEYYTGDTTITIFAVSNSAVDAVTVPCDSAFWENITAMRRALPELNYISYLSAAFNLYVKLIGPVKGFLRDKEKLYIIPDKRLAYLPFEALLMKPPPKVFNADFRDLPYLINNYTISYHYSSGLLRDALLHKNKNQNMSFAGFVPVFTYNTKMHDAQSVIDTNKTGNIETRSALLKVKMYSSLPETEGQVKSISRLFEGNDYQSDIFAEKSSIQTQLKQDKIFGYKFIHFAVPAFINDEHPRNTGLVFYNPEDSTDNGILYVGDIYDLRLNSDLLVMNTYEVSLGNTVTGKGIYALTRSFLYAGTKNIVIPLWQITDKSASVLMINFYKNILDGMAYAEALRKTKLDMIQEEQYSYPLQWSPYILIGN